VVYTVQSVAVALRLHKALICRTVAARTKCQRARPVTSKNHHHSDDEEEEEGRRDGRMCSTKGITTKYCY